jgi:hypothetical protein
MAKVHAVAKGLFRRDNDWSKNCFAQIAGIDRFFSGESDGSFIGFGCS